MLINQQSQPTIAKFHPVHLHRITKSHTKNEFLLFLKYNESNWDSESIKKELQYRDSSLICQIGGSSQYSNRI